MLLLEVLVHPTKVAPTVAGQIPARILLFLAVPEQRAVEPANLRCPWQLHERLGLGNANQFSRFRAIAQIVAGPVREKVDRRAIDQLKALLGNASPSDRQGMPLPMILPVTDTNCR